MFKARNEPEYEQKEQIPGCNPDSHVWLRSVSHSEQLPPSGGGLFTYDVTWDLSQEYCTPFFTK